MSRIDEASVADFFNLPDMVMEHAQRRRRSYWGCASRLVFNAGSTMEATRKRKKNFSCVALQAGIWEDLQNGQRQQLLVVGSHRTAKNQVISLFSPN
jgi:hypothetical protein